METITISASTGVGTAKEYVGEISVNFPTTIDELKAWTPDGEKVALTEKEVLDLVRRSYVIDEQRKMRPNLLKEKSEKLAALKAAAAKDVEFAAKLAELGIKV